ncbi:MAG: sigma-54 dependent transcriptional regulator, partial [Thermodesulfobacteriota bacterium]|nr:sigma-54 dependent transcriptional regulator [Thermodesulfobacteriota bacterium]
MDLVVKLNLLIVDDESDMTKLLKRILDRENFFNIYMANNGFDAIKIINAEEIDIVLTDIKMPVMDGIELLSRIKTINPNITVILMTAYGTIEIAVEAMKKGGYDFITKPFDDERILLTLRKAKERTILLNENRKFRILVNEDNFFNLVGMSMVMKSIYKTISKVAETDANILITGESGTGKELAARAIHALSKRRNKEMISVNCPALPDTMLESELFGYKKGAFTGAIEDKKGLFEIADGKTIFLDEIGDLHPSVQAKLLRVLQQGEVKALGDLKTKYVDARVIASTNVDLEKKLKEKQFREDLFYRLSEITIKMPSLRQRKEDIPLLANHFLKLYSPRLSKSGNTFSDDAILTLMSHDWIGNVRELENTIKRAIIFSSGKIIYSSDLGLE